MRVHHFNEARQLDIASDIVVLGHNSENADYSNPRGEFYGYACYIVVEAADGRRWAHDHTIKSLFESDALAELRPLQQRMQARLDAGGRLNPKHWSEIQAAYGSEAYTRDGWQQELLDWENRCDEDEALGLR